MLNNEIYQLFSARVSGFMTESKSYDVISHHGNRGRFREILISGLLNPLLPANCICLHGATAQTASRELFYQSDDDILIVDKNVMPSFLIGQENAVVPIESVLCRIEVKTKLTAEELKDSAEKASNYRKIKFGLLSGKSDEPYDFVPQVLFAFGADVGKDELQRYYEQCPVDAQSSNPPIMAICVMSKGFWFFGGLHQKSCEQVNNWRYIREDSSHREILAFLGVLHNTLLYSQDIRRLGPKVAESIQNTRVMKGFDSYLWDGNESEIIDLQKNCII